MKIAKHLLSVAAVGMAMSASASALTNEHFFAGIVGAQSSSSYDRSGRAATQLPEVRFNRVIDDTHSWGIRGGVDQGGARYYLSYHYASDSYHSLASLREQTLSGSYDLAFPIADSTRLFGGASAGLTHIKQDTARFASDSDWGVHAGIQLGVLQQLGDAAELEAGYRYTLHDRASVELVDRGAATRLGRIDLDNSEQWYLGLNWHF